MTRGCEDAILDLTAGKQKKVRMPMRGNGRVKVRRMTRNERKSFRKRTQAELYMDMPRSRLVQVVEDEKRDTFGSFLDYGGKYYR